MTLGILILTFLAPWTAGPLWASESPDDQPASVTEADRRSALARDVPDLIRWLREKHANPFWLRSEKDFAQVEAELQRSVADGASSEELVTQMLRLIAVIGDGHTVLASGDRYGQFGIAPFFAELHDDGVFLFEVPKTQERTLGAEILAVGGVPIQRALDRLRSVVPHSNDSRFRRWARSYLHLPGLARALGLADDADNIRLTLRLQSGEMIDAVFPRMTLDAYRELEMVSLTPPRTLRHRNPDAKYWFEPIPDSNIVYFNFRRVTSDDDGESIWAFGPRMVEYLQEHSTERLIIDLRENGGGGYQFAAHLRPLLRTVETLDQPGGILILTGPKTYSAASNFLSQMQRFTHATTLGRPPGGSIGEPGDDDDFELPHSKLTVRISQVAGRTESGLDARRIVGVDHPVEETFTDLMAGRDATLEAAIAYTAPATPSARLSPQWAGRYRFAPDADLVVRRVGNQWRATVLPRLDTPLIPLGPRRAMAALPGLALELDAERGEGIRLILADGSERFCPRKASDAPSAWELVFQGEIDRAAPLLREALAAAPESPSLTDGSFSMEAIHLVFTLQPIQGNRAARAAARKLLETGIALHPEGAPESTFSLRFYPPPED